MTLFIRQHQLLTFFVLTYAFSWTMVALVSVSFAFALLALFGPMLAAVIVTALADGRTAVKRLLGQITIWRVGVLPYALAIGVPLVIAVAAQVVYAFAFGGQVGITASSVPLTVILALLVVGEEVGWRGFALPHLLTRFSGLVASLLLGTVWACWHLVNATIPGLEVYWYAFPAFLFVLGQTIFFTWLWNRAGGSLLVMWILHAAVNVTGSLFVGDQVMQWWLAGAGFAIVAIIVVLVDGPNLTRQTVPPVAVEGRLPRAAGASQ